MKTPVVDFVSQYAARKGSRLHMPGHKGTGPLGCEALDITEVAGADDLSCPEGILLESEENATALFGTRHTFYLAGGSSQGIKAMLHLAHGAHPAGKILAGRNAHKAFVHGCGLLGLEPVWLQPEGSSLCACPITAEYLEDVLRREGETFCGIYITAPDYLGSLPDIAALAAAAHAHGLPLLVDNAHGAYLKFCGKHPMDLGADLCCDSAHKTLPVLTGGAYLHVSPTAEAPYERFARAAAAIYGSSSPSYLILQSLDLCNRYLAEALVPLGQETARQVNRLSEALPFPDLSQEPWKLTLHCAAIGADGEAVGEALRRQNIEPEFVDPDFVVMMFSPGNTSSDYEAVERTLSRWPVSMPRPMAALPQPGGKVLTIRQALFSPQEQLPVGEASGRICGAAAISCPPAIPVVLPGERITEETAAHLTRLGIETINVVAG